MIKFCPLHFHPINTFTKTCKICDEIMQEEENSTRYAREAEYDGRGESGEVVVD